MLHIFFRFICGTATGGCDYKGSLQIDSDEFSLRLAVSYWHYVL